MNIATLRTDYGEKLDLTTKDSVVLALILIEIGAIIGPAKVLLEIHVTRLITGQKLFQSRRQPPFEISSWPEKTLLE